MRSDDSPAPCCYTENLAMRLYAPKKVVDEVINKNTEWTVEEMCDTREARIIAPYHIYKDYQAKQAKVGASCS